MSFFNIGWQHFRFTVTQTIQQCDQIWQNFKSLGMDGLSSIWHFSAQIFVVVNGQRLNNTMAV